MKTYIFKRDITEKLKMEVEIEAENEAQAREIAERIQKNSEYSEYLLDADHYKRVTVILSCVQEPRIGTAEI